MLKLIQHIIRDAFVLFAFLFAFLGTQNAYSVERQLGDLAPRGATDGLLNVADILIMQRIVNGLIPATSEELIVGNVSPLGAPDTEINAADLLILQRAVLGEITLGTVNVSPQPPVLDTVLLPSNKNPLPISGTTTPGLDVELYVNNQLQITLVADVITGVFSSPATLFTGTNEIYATVSDGVDTSMPSNILSIDIQVIWTAGESPGITTQLSSAELLQLELCNALNNCLQDAVDVGAYYFNIIDDTKVAYYDANGNIVGVETYEVAEGGTLTFPEDPPIPPATTVVGTLAGDFSVSPSGAANYSIPIEIPAGTAGMQPEISLVYDSQSSNGVVGVGWSIGGISQITRCPQNMAIDGSIRPVLMSSEDRFCLNGHRLIAVSGVYGLSGTQYRTEIDSLSKITSYGSAGGGPEYFVMETPSGATMTFGFVGGVYDSRFEASVYSEVAIVDVAIEAWALGKVEDIHGNYYKIAYEEDPDNICWFETCWLASGSGVNRVVRIDYTGNELNQIDPYASVEFVYESRSDRIEHWEGGSATITDERLTNIKTSIDGSLIKNYTLSYQYSQATQQSILTSIQECYTPTICRLATNFSWQNGALSLTSQSWATSYEWLSGPKTFPGDFNGDGKTDLMSFDGYRGYMRLSTASGFEDEEWWMVSGYYVPPPDYDYARTGDFNADGMTDVVSLRGGSLHMFLSSGDGFDIPNGDGLSNGEIWASSVSVGDKSLTWAADFNGDGRSDYATRINNAIHVYISTGTSFTLEIWDINSHSWDTDGLTWAGDFNGDGLTDIATVPVANGDVQLHLSTGTSFENPVWSTDVPWDYLGVPDTGFRWNDADSTWLGDFNGDGVTDIATQLGNYGSIIMRLSSGKSFVSQLWTGDGTSWSGTTWTGDFNGDGMTDIAVYNTFSNANILGNEVGTIRVHLSTGTGFKHEDRSEAYTPVTSITSTGDFNGDGISDIYAVDSGVAYMKLSTGSFPNLLTSAANGLGSTSTVSYAPLTDNSIYQKGAAAEYPYSDLQTPKQIVQLKTTLDGLGGNTITTYSYGGDKAHHNGRGSVGFEWTKSVNQNTGLVTKVDYRQDFPFIGSVKNETQTLNGAVISSSTKTMSVELSDKGLSIPFVSNEVIISNDINGTPLKTVTNTSVIDGYGNVKESTVQTTSPDSSETYTTTTKNVYGLSGSASWCKNFVPTKTTTDKSGASGASPTAIKEFTYTNKCQLQTENGHVIALDSSRSDGLTKTHVYDAYGHATGTTISGAGIASRGVSTVYDTRGRFPISVTNEHGHVSTMISDERFGGVTSSTDANGLTTTTVHDDFGQVIEATAPGGIRVVTERDWCTVNCTVPSLGAGLQSQTAAFTITKKFYGGTGSLEQMAPDAIVYYDSLGREIRTENSDASGRTIYVDTNYDSLGRVRHSTQPYFSNAPADRDTSITTTAYDTLSRPVSTTSPDGGVTRIGYNGLNVTYYNDVLDPITGGVTTQSRTEINNIIGQNIQTIDNAGQSIYREFDAIGNNIRILKPKLNADGTTVLDIKGNVTSFVYDVFGRKTSMSDPDMGTWSYTYNVLSELKSQTDAKSQRTSMTYDLMGRMITRTDADGAVTTWTYNDNLNASEVPVPMGIGKLDNVVMVNGATEQYQKTVEYELNLGLPIKTTVKLFDNINDSYITEVSYDRFNRPEILTYPETSTGQAFKARNVYDSAGLLSAIQSEDASTNYWQSSFRDAASRIIASRLGNGTSTWRTLDKAGRTDLLSIADASTNKIYEAEYAYDTMGNLLQREETRGNGPLITEQYSYDNLNRLTIAVANAVTTLSNSYDILGNIRNKSGVGVYAYSDARPHAVTAAGGNSYVYDLNGNLINSGAKSVTWTSFSKPQAINISGAYNTGFDYGPERARFRRVDYDVQANTYTETRYVGGIYEKVVSGTNTKHKHYIRGGDGVVATYTIIDDGTAQTSELEYMHRDYQGSVVAVSSDIGTNGYITVKAQLGFDVFGNRKPVQGASSVDPIIDNINRGYTGHEHLDGVGLIHMNGRVYDPQLGRFLSADPLVQAPNNLQSYNRYSYVFNNPMSFTDPSGYFSVRRAFRKVAKAALGVSILSSPLASTAVMYTKPAKRFMLKHEWARVAGQVGAGVADAATLGHGGFSAAYSAYITDISGGSFGDVLRSAAISYAATKAFNAVHDLGGVPNILAHGAIGGVMADLGGGKFSDGFWAAGVSAAVTPYVYDSSGRGYRAHIVYNSIAASIVGGSISRGLGGSFEQGAKSALYGVLFNEMGNNLRLRIMGEASALATQVHNTDPVDWAREYQFEYFLDSGFRGNLSFDGFVNTFDELVLKNISTVNMDQMLQEFSLREIAAGNATSFIGITADAIDDSLSAGAKVISGRSPVTTGWGAINSINIRRDSSNSVNIYFSCTRNNCNVGIQ